ncbi:unnamed protein product, partial [Meganyctiphanes norvegica]
MSSTTNDNILTTSAEKQLKTETGAETGVKSAFSGVHSDILSAVSGVRGVLKEKKQGSAQYDEEELGITEILTKSTKTHSTNDKIKSIEPPQRKADEIDRSVNNSKDLVKKSEELSVKDTTLKLRTETKPEDQDKINLQESTDSFESDVFLPLETKQIVNTSENSFENVTVDKEKINDCNISNVENKENGEWMKTGSAPSTPTPNAPGIGGIARKGCRVSRSRRVSFPEDDTHLITSYLEPVNPWKKMAGVTTDDIAVAYRTSCERHRTRPLPQVLQQIMALPLGFGKRIECLSLRGQRLDMNQCEGLEEIFRRVQFKVLDFENCQLDDESAIPLFDMIEFYDSSTQLNISCNSKIGVRGWQACARMLKRSPSVEYLDARSTNLNEQNMPMLGRALRLGTKLHTLHLENCNLTGRPMIMLAAALRQNDTLLELYLSDNRLGINDCIQLGNLARANTTLRIMDLRNNNVQDLGCQHICEGIVEQQKQQQVDLSEGNVSPDTIIKGLNSLVLWNNHLTGSCSQYIAPMLSVTTTLQTLNLGRNGLACSAVLRLKDSLLRNRALLRLGLQACKVGDEGAVALAEYTADNPVIQRIDLRENPIRVAGLMALALSMRVNTTVVQLDLDAEPRSEPGPEYAEQHLAFHREIKEYCTRNLTAQHIRSQENSDMQASQTLSCIEDEINSVDVTRKNSLTCGLAPLTKLPLFDKQTQIIKEEEKQKYTSPEPSPLPSPSISPFNSPLVSPLKNRFRVSRVQELSNTKPTSTTEVTVSYTHVIATPNLHARSLSVGDLGVATSLKTATSARPNRFSTGSRFTVTRVVEQSNVPLCSSLPIYKNSSPVIAPIIKTASKTSESTTGPRIVISSPVKIERGFSVDGLPIPPKQMENKSDIEQTNTPILDPVETISNGSISVGNDSNAEESPEPPILVTNRLTRLESDGSSGSDDVFVDPPNSVTGSTKISKKDVTNPQAGNNQSTVSNLNVSDLTDSGYHDDNGGGRSPVPSGSSSSPSVCEGDRDSLLSSSMDSSSQEDTGLGSSLDSTTMPTLTTTSSSNIQPPNHTIQHTSIRKAPLAAMENGSFDTDSEESEITTQSSDSTHSDEVGITTEQIVAPRLAWADKTLQQTQINV